MGRAFLSHSSKDKILVEAVARKLGNKYCIYDNFTFEEGQKNLDEINKSFEDTDLFVIFLSNNSLESEWVKKELEIAYNKLLKKEIGKIYPIIIDGKISYEDPRIPKWLKEYNLQKITKSERIKKIILRLLKEIGWEKSDFLKQKNTFFCGRNDLVEKLETEYYDFQKKVNCFVASGFSLIGRKSLMKYTLEKLNLLSKAHTPNIIKFKDSESIEDFIKKLFDLGIVDFSIENFDFFNETQEVKINKLISIIEKFQEIKEIIFIDDFGGIILPNGDVVDWFKIAIQKLENSQFIFGISSKFNIKRTYLYDKIGTVQVKLLDKNDRKKMFATLLNIEQINDLNNEYKEEICELFKGYPEQIRYSIELIKENSRGSYDFFPDIVDYNMTNSAKIFNDFIEDERNIIILIAYLEIVEKNLLYEIINNDKLLNDILNRPHLQNIFEYSGLSDYINVSENLQDFIIRSNFKILEEYNERLNKSLNNFKKELETSDSYVEIDHTIIDLIVTQNFNKNSQLKIALPSHYLKTIIKLYKIKRNYKQVIIISKKFFETENNFDEYLVKEIRKYMCLALAREKDSSVMQEVEKIKNEADKFFIKGLYYRQIGKYKEAYSFQCKTLELQPSYTGAQREILQIYTILGKIDEALIYAKKLYDESNKNNPYTIQGYLLSLIKSKNNKDENKKIINELLMQLKKIGTDISIEMYKRAEISYKAFIENNYDVLKKIKELSESYPENHYILMEMFDIADKFNDFDLMEESNKKLKELAQSGRKNLENAVNINEIIFKNKCGNDINADLSAIKSKIPEEIFKKLEQRIHGKNIKEIF
ncbi:toll/interleukin-1 receptor domain-containing protein [Fusobacterium animalis]|uniref:TIR domain-containing protein n=1 Tax=Fusobacterium animalis TaxID=76859 RepID=UPI003247B3AD